MNNEHCGFPPVNELFSRDEIARVDELIKQNRCKPGSLIPVLEKAQDVLGYLPVPVQLHIARGLNLPPASVYGVVTFYSFFTMVPRGRHIIRVCLGTACYVRGGKKILNRLRDSIGIQAGECTADRRFSIETVRCLGACGLAPVMVVDQDTYGQMNPRKIDDILSQYE
jgi:NADH:ubiquinone oxidoreductase subunit E